MLYQITLVFEFISKDFKKMGLALMDGNFFSFLPKGASSKHLLYHVSHSVLKQKKNRLFPKDWLNIKFSNKIIKLRSSKILKEIKKFFPNIQIRLTKKIYLSSRVLPANQKKTDKRVSKIFNFNNKYFKISSAKIDHCVDVADEVLKSLEIKK